MNIKHIKYLTDWVLSVEFTDGKQREIDFKPFLDLHKKHPMMRPYLNLKRFKEFEFHTSHITWNEEMDFSAESLYKSDWTEDGVKQSRLKLLRYALSTGIIDQKRFDQMVNEEELR